MSQPGAVELTVAQPPRTAPTGVLQMVNLEAAEHHWEPGDGMLLAGYAYNAHVPGPVIEATVGDTLLVRFTNRLPEPTTLHWHGLRVDAAMDGHDWTEPVPPGSSVEYRLDLPDAGTFWYHPHRHVQLDRGLYGAIVVRDPGDPRLAGERLLVFDDVKPNRHEHATTAVAENGCGREGDVLLVNGVREPQMQITAGHVERWRLVNASSARYLHLSLDGHQLHILGTDGGLIAAPHPVTELLMVPGDRYDLAVGPFPHGVTVALEALTPSRASGTPQRHRLATLHAIEADSHSASAPLDLARFCRGIAPLARPTAESTRILRLGGRLTGHGAQEPVDGSHPEGAPARVGELQVWELLNDTDTAHPFYLHGFFFQVLDINGAPPPYTSWEDTVNVPGRGRVRIVWLPDDRPGRWTYHCHSPEHHAGTMTRFQVVP
jgi:FtsP/CotA-like multicopper oxidase with cupredoxin domain